MSKKLENIVKQSKKAKALIKDNNKKIKPLVDQVEHLNKKNRELAKKIAKGKYIGKYVIVNHIDGDGSWCYYSNNGNDPRGLLMEGTNNPTLIDLTQGDGNDDKGSLFTKDEVERFISDSLKKVSKLSNCDELMLKVAKARLYASVFPAKDAVCKCLKDAKEGYTDPGLF